MYIINIVINGTGSLIVFSGTLQQPCKVDRVLMVLNDSTKKRKKKTFVEHSRALYYPEICAPLLVGSLT